MWEISNSFQVLSFFRALILGVFLGFFYDFWRSVRKVKKFGTLSVFFQDLSYFFIASPIIFSFLLSLTNGEIRAFIFIAIILGFIIYRVTLSVLIFKIFICVFKFIFINFTRLNSFYYRMFDSFFAFLKKIFDFFMAFFEKWRNYRKKVLKKK
ncbi:MAG: spore cortex biosynthesis protein YabQ [Clostridia bacterium]|nr:spore cortex biosynthesis protein YabQ [Clostridia bacterium]